MHSTYLNWKCLLYKLTWPLRIAPEICGARNPIMFPTELVIPIKVPANLGAISSWLQVTALKLKPLMPKVAQSKTTTRYLWQPTKWSIHKQIAGGINAENVFLYQNIIDFWKICMSWSPHISRIHELVNFQDFLLPMRSVKKKWQHMFVTVRNSWNHVFK